MLLKFGWGVGNPPWKVSSLQLMDSACFYAKYGPSMRLSISTWKGNSCQCRNRRGSSCEVRKVIVSCTLEFSLEEGNWGDWGTGKCYATTFFFLMKASFYLFIYLFLAVLGLRFCARSFSSCSERGPLFIAVRRSLTVAASLVAEHKLQTRRLSSCGSRA